MTPEVQEALEQELRGDEGEVLRVYDDATGHPLGPGMTIKGNPTIGVGRNLSSRGLTRSESDMLLGNDIEQCETDLTPILPWVASLSPGRQTVIYSLYFNTGLGNPQRFTSGWPHFLQQMQSGDYAAAADNLESSQPWASQVGPRAKRLADLVRFG